MEAINSKETKYNTQLNQYSSYLHGKSLYSVNNINNSTLDQSKGWFFATR